MEKTTYQDYFEKLSGYYKPATKSEKTLRKIFGADYQFIYAILDYSEGFDKEPYVGINLVPTQRPIFINSKYAKILLKDKNNSKLLIPNSCQTGTYLVLNNHNSASVDFIKDFIVYDEAENAFKLSEEESKKDL